MGFRAKSGTFRALGVGTSCPRTPAPRSAGTRRCCQDPRRLPRRVLPVALNFGKWTRAPSGRLWRSGRALSGSRRRSRRGHAPASAIPQPPRAGTRRVCSHPRRRASSCAGNLPQCAPTPEVGTHTCGRRPSPRRRRSRVPHDPRMHRDRRRPRVDRPCRPVLMCSTASTPSRAASDSPTDSCPNSSTHPRGSGCPSNGTEPGRLSMPSTGSGAPSAPAVCAHASRSSTPAWWCTCRYRSVTIAPRRFHRRRPTTCTPAALNALAVRTTDPMFRSCAQFSMATWNGCRRVSRSATTASTVQYRYRSTTLRRSPWASSSGS